MKLWKKALAFLMSLGFVFSATACGNDSESSKKPSGSDNEISATDGDDKKDDDDDDDDDKSDKDDDDDDKSDKDDDDDDDDGKKPSVGDKKTYLEDIGSAIANAKSFKLNLDMEFSNSDEGGDHKESGAIDGEITVTLNDDGIFDLKIEIDVENTYNTSLHEENLKMYVKDGYAYGYNTYEEKWEKYYKPYDELLAEELEHAGLTEDVIEAYIEQLEAVLEDETFVAVMEAVKTGVAQTAEIKDGMFVIKLDAAELVNGVVDYILADKSIEEMANDALALVTDDLEITDILEVVASYGTKTVEDVYDEVDAWFEETCDMGVQEVYETIVNSDEYVEYMTVICEMQGVPADEIEIALERVQSFDIYEELEAVDALEMTGDELWVAFMNATDINSSGAPQTWAAFIEGVEEHILLATLSTIIDEEGWEELKTVCEGTKANELYASFGAKYNEDDEIDYIELAFGLDIETVTVGHQGAIGGNGGESSSAVYEGQFVEVEYKLAFSEISAETVEIRLPNAVKNAETYYEECVFCYETAEVEKYYTKYGSSYYACPECAEEYTCVSCNQFVGYDYCCICLTDRVVYCYDCCTHDEVENREYEGQYVLKYIQESDHIYNLGENFSFFILGENYDISVDVKYEVDNAIYFTFMVEYRTEIMNTDVYGYVEHSGFIEINEAGDLEFFKTGFYENSNGEVQEGSLEEATYFGTARVFDGFMQLDCVLENNMIVGLQLA